MESIQTILNKIKYWQIGSQIECDNRRSIMITQDFFVIHLR